LNRQKIAFVIGGMGKGGAERVVSNLVGYYHHAGFEIEIVMLLHNKVEYDLPRDVKLTYIDSRKYSPVLKPLVWLKKLRDIIKEDKPDVIVSFFARINLLVLLAAIGIDIPVYISERNDPKDDGRSIVIRFLTSILYPLSKGIVFQTDHAYRCFPKAIQKKGVIIPNPINIDFDFSRKKTKTYEIVTAGRLIEQKNHRLLIHAFEQVVRNNKLSNYKLYIYGEGRLKSKLSELIESKGLNNHVFLMGKTSDIYNKVYNADLFVLSSDYEGLSNALLEAMFLETPVISTNCAGSNELIADNENGRLVPIGDCDRLAQAIEQNLLDDDKATAMAQKAKRKVSEYTLESICFKWNQLLFGAREARFEARKGTVLRKQK